MKMLIGFLFSLGMAGFSLSKIKVYGKTRAIILAIVSLIASIIFLGQFISGA